MSDHRWHYTPADSSSVFGDNKYYQACNSPFFTKKASDAGSPVVILRPRDVEIHMDKYVWREVLSFASLPSLLALATAGKQWHQSVASVAQCGINCTSTFVDASSPTAAPQFWQTMRGIVPEDLRDHIHRILHHASKGLPGPPDVILVFVAGESWDAWAEQIVRILRAAVPSPVAVLISNATSLRSEPSAHPVNDGIAISVFRLGRPLHSKGPAAVAAAAAAARATCVHDGTGACADGLDLVRLLELDPLES